MTQRLKSFLSRRPTRIAPEPLQVKTTNMNTNNSQTKKNMSQRLKSFFSRGPTRIAPAPHNVIEMKPKAINLEAVIASKEINFAFA